jgi:hypothetical protein
MSITTDIIESLFSHELSAHNWAKYNTQAIREIITIKYNLAHQEPIPLEMKILLKKLKDHLTMEESLAILTDELMGKMQG